MRGRCACARLTAAERGARGKRGAVPDEKASGATGARGGVQDGVRDHQRHSGELACVAGRCRMGRRRFGLPDGKAPLRASGLGNTPLQGRCPSQCLLLPNNAGDGAPGSRAATRAMGRRVNWCLLRWAAAMDALTGGGGRVWNCRAPTAALVAAAGGQRASGRGATSFRRGGEPALCEILSGHQLPFDPAGGRRRATHW